jgi:hypothetical protein
MTFRLSLQEGQAGDTWEPSTNVKLFIPAHTAVSHFGHSISCYVLLYYTFYSLLFLFPDNFVALEIMKNYLG